MTYAVEVKEALEIGIEAIDKQIPKKIIKEEGGKIRCPNRHNIPLEYKRGKMPYCPFCGQKLDWSEEE